MRTKYTVKMSIWNIVWIIGNIYFCLLYTSLEEVPLRMISYGGSAHNISVLVKEEDKKKAMTDLSHKLEDLQH